MSSYLFVTKTFVMHSTYFIKEKQMNKCLLFSISIHDRAFEGCFGIF